MSDPTTPKYDVFVSFRGEDTRDNFTSHLYAELCRKKIETFIDNRLGRGEEISPALYKAIEESKIYVIILSEHYASSSWCLDELTEILKCKERYGREVIPVFYKVDPSNVRHQRQSYGEDFVRHQQRSKDKVDAWKAALFQAAGLSGWDSQVIRPESTLVTEIVKDILKKMSSCFLSEYEGMPGIDMHIEQIQSLLHLELQNVRLIGIWGMGGIGKTTIASAIFEKLATQFCSKIIILNVQQEIERVGLDHVKSKYLSKLLGEDIKSFEYNFSFDPRLKRTKVLLVFDDVKDSDQLKDLNGTHSNFGQGSRIIVTSRDKQVLKNANADNIYQVREMDYQDSLQLFCLFAFKQKQPIESYASLAEKVLDYAKGLPLALKVLGSLLYGKTKEAWESQLQKLKKLPDLKIFRLLKLSYDGLDEEQKDIFLDVACFHRGKLEKVVALTLDSCGFSAYIGMDVLKDRSLIYISNGRVLMHDLIQEMGHEIVRLQSKDDPGKRSRLWKQDDVCDVFKKNKGTDAIQCIFLNIWTAKELQLNAKSFKKMHNLRMIQISYATLRPFLESLPDNLKFLRWHGFPQRSLPQNFCPENLITLDMHKSHLKQLWERDQALPNLKRLQLGYSQKLKRLPDLSLCPNIEEVILSGCESLVEVYSSSFLNKLNWLCLDGCISLQSLDIHSNILSRSYGLVALRGCHNLETLLICGRVDVVQSDSWPPLYQHQVYISVAVFYDNMQIQCDREGGYEIVEFGSDWFTPDIITSINEFCWLDVSNCKSLTCLPAELFNLKLLRRLCLNGCLKLEELPEIEETVENLKVLMLDGTAIRELPSSLHRLVGLEELSLERCTKLKTIPSSIGNLSKLLKLDLSYCASLETFPSSIFKLKLRELNCYGCSILRTFPEIPEPAESVAYINLTKTAIKELPLSLHRLVGLEELSLQSCTRLKTIPSSIGNLSKLVKLNLAYCASLKTFPSIIFKLKLTELNFEGCSMLQTFPEILEPAESFAHINLTKTAIHHLPSSLEYLVGLQTLNLKLCINLVSLPNNIVKLSLLSHLDCSGCCRLTEIPSNIGCLSSMTELSLEGSSIVNLPESMAHLSSLKYLNLNGCELLECVPKLPPNLTDVWAFDCPSIKRMVLNSRSDFKEGTFAFGLTNCQELDSTSWSNIREEACSKINDDAYRLVFFCFPGSAIPCWFHYCYKGHSVTMKKDSPNLCSKNRLIGFALCAVLDHTRTRYSKFCYKFGFISNGEIYSYDHIMSGSLFFHWNYPGRFLNQDHTILWKHELDLKTIGNKLFHAQNFTFEFPSEGGVKECGICPLYTKETDDTMIDDDDDDGLEGPSGSKAAQ